MADDPVSPQEISPMPDSVSDHLDSVESVVDGLPVLSEEPNSSETSTVAVDSFTSSQSPTTYTGEPASVFSGHSGRVITKKAGHSVLPTCTIASVIPVASEFHLPGSSSAFRPFVVQASLSSAREITSSSSQNLTSVSSAPVSKHETRLSLPGVSSFSSLQHKSPSLSPNRPVLLGETSSHNDEEDGRTTASAPPCTPAPEPHQQPQSPFRGNRMIKKIDLLAMSRSRQSDRAENARRDGRLAPSPRKKDEVLRNSGFTFPAGRGFGTHSSLRLSMQNNNLLSNDIDMSPERLLNGASGAASPNVDVVSVDDQADPSKCTFSIQFHDFAPAEQMMKCSMCGFVTNNQRFYRRHKRLHSRQYQPNLIHCSLCDYSTSQVRKMREHTFTSHHLSHPHSFISSSQSFHQHSTVPESTDRPQVQGQMCIGTGSIYQPVTIRPVNIPVEAASTTISGASTLGLPAYIPVPQEHHIQVNTEAGLQHPPRGSAMLGNYGQTDEQQMASYMRSVVSNLASPPHNDPSSTVTSSNLYLQAARNFPQESHAAIPSNSNIPIVEETYNYRQFWNSNSNSRSLNNGHNISGPGFVKVKTEPRTAPAILLSRSLHDTPSSTKKDRPIRSPHQQPGTLDSESGMDMSSDDHASSPQPCNGPSYRVNARISTETSETESNIQTDRPAFETQRSMPFIKIEFPPLRESCSYLGRSSCTTHHDRGVQCEIISASGLSHRHGRTQSETVSSAGGSAHVDTRCYFCGVTFDDEVLYTIHIGCHSHTDPFVCNVCGKQCHNKYGFYSHIMRGHQTRPNT